MKMAFCSSSYGALSCRPIQWMLFCRTKQMFKVSRCLLHVTHQTRKSAETELCRQLKAKIHLTGPITVAEYMKEVLTNPAGGYYMNRDVFGSEGDFITSPEISQMFGELIGVWCVNEWMRCGSPANIQVVEFGPGRGTLMDDMLRAFSRFNIIEAVSVHLVEVSPTMSQIQLKKLCGESEKGVPSSTEAWYQESKSRHGPVVQWYNQLSDVPRGFSFYVAHEFFDVLPVHIFQKKDGVWHEMLIDVDETSDGEHHLRFVLSFTSTTASTILLQKDFLNQCDTVEICPEAGVIMENITNRIEQDGGFGLIADYGHMGEKGLTFRAFKKHQLHHPLCEPGTADLTADVNFAYLKNVIKNRITTVGPIPQMMFLQNMGITVRLQMLLKNASPDAHQSLISGYRMLTDPDQMGEKFKFFALLQHSDGYIPAGFTPS